MVIDPLARFLVGALAIALAAPCLAAAVAERPPAARVPRTVIAIMLLWAVVFVAAAVDVLIRLDHFGVFGLLAAAGELLVAGAIWALRGERRDDGGDDGGSAGPVVPEEYWSRWEASFEPAGSLGGSTNP